MFEKVGIKKSMADAVEPEEIAKMIEFIMTLKSTTTIPELGIKNIESNPYGK